MIEIKTDVVRIVAELDQMAQSQIPFAAAKALTDLASEIQREAREDLAHKFTIRRQWVSGGIKVEKAKKTDFPNLEAQVGSIDPFMLLQEEGGEKLPLKNSVAVPIAARKEKSQVTSPRMWPSALLQGKENGTKDYARVSMPGFKYPLIIRRLGRSRIKKMKRAAKHSELAKRKARLHNQFLIYYILSPHVTVPARWEFWKLGLSVCDKKYEKLFYQELMAAICGAKK